MFIFAQTLVLMSATCLGAVSFQSSITDLKGIQLRTLLESKIPQLRSAKTIEQKETDYNLLVKTLNSNIEKTQGPEQLETILLRNFLEELQWEKVKSGKCEQIKTSIYVAYDPQERAQGYLDPSVKAAFAVVDSLCGRSL